MTDRTVSRIVRVRASHWVGDGFLVRPIFGDLAFTAVPSPFLMLDWAAPHTFPPSDTPRGVGVHPHRGFETVTIVYDGEIEHRDSAGHAGRIGPGDVQWMTAGAGILHEEKHGAAFSERGGTVSMAQLWVNLPAAAKATPPRYQSIAAAAIPTVTAAGGRFRVIAGALEDPTGIRHHGPAETFSPLAVWDGRLAPGERFTAPIEPGWTVMVVVLDGAATIGGRRIGTAEMALLTNDGERITVIDAGESCHLLVLSGRPIDESIAHYGPFVMNSREELFTAIDDFRNGKMGDLVES
jgi:redox-sensitive bicupin YhaK (pirin superfamily)